MLISEFLETLKTLSLEEKQDLLIELSERFEEVSPSIAKRPFDSTHRIPGCESEVYVWATPDDAGNFRFHFAVENPQGISARALAVILQEALSSQPPEVIQAVNPEIVYEIFGKGLTMGRGQGMMGMINAIKSLSRSHGNK